MYSPVFFQPGASFRFRQDFSRKISEKKASKPTKDSPGEKPTRFFTQPSGYSPTLTDYVLLGVVLWAGIPRLTIISLLKPYVPREPGEGVY